VNAVDLGSPALAVTVLAGLVAGLASALVFRRFTDSARLRRTVNRMLAHVLELRLFLDEPPLVFRAQRDLLLENARLLRLVFLPCLLLAIPYTLLINELNAFLGHAPLAVGVAAVITVHLDREPATDLELIAPPQFAVETAGVHVLASRQVSWRLRPLQPAAGEIAVRGAGPERAITVIAGPGIHRLTAVRWIEVPYPQATVLGFHWAVWFSLSTLLGAVIGTRGFSRVRM
jgi:hypothetical protein